jgi:nucleoside phosphorylase
LHPTRFVGQPEECNYDQNRRLAFFHPGVGAPLAAGLLEEVIANEVAVNALAKTLSKRGVPYRIGKTWTTDAPYRETADKIARRKDEGCLTVEMESAGMMAVAQFRDVILGQVLYGGDDLSGPEWSNRAWQSRDEIRESLFWLGAQACLAI